MNSLVCENQTLGSGGKQKKNILLFIGRKFATLILCLTDNINKNILQEGIRKGT